MLDIVTLGLAPGYVPYSDAWATQRRRHEEVVAGTRPDTLFLLEHEAVYTAGARSTPDDRPDDGTPVVDVDRGGRITWHGPGQLVGYPIVRLAEPVDVVAHVRRLEELLMTALREFGVAGRRVEGRSGVWAGPHGGESKVAAIGVRVQRGVTMHGFALNCDNSLEPFDRIVPCGIADAGVTTVSEIIGSRVAPREVAGTVASVFSAAFDAEVAA
ncbi:MULTISPECIES: lipoyl(octanoyl) transferase LipB [unclassified Microbacterium]|uniref:lipoyl(octanoyl) transferase LipB n=1 Tax=unclassified Microbacterium TaxID=2609290 RepID=UPI00386E442D